VLDPATSLSDIIRNRHSARAPYDPSRPLPEADLEAILEAARWAPTAHNMQTYERAIVDFPV
jgi:nitroreductase